ncbi:MAG: Ig-like domain-containing protein [Lachnospiraceae bacterium]|nr:Ig-like domain-containing protein [Lachnospiraceae bacterium]
MMKSFFKKLSLTMALAMVVTTAAPAAQASAAEASLGIALQEATSKDEVKSIFSVGVDKTVDLKYYGAPKNFAKLNPTWTSSDEKVATVDQKGNVTGVAEGVATITIALSDGTEGSAKVIVGNDYSANALGIALQGAKSKDEVITEFALAVDATEDFKYYGAPKYFAKLNPQWASSDEDVATVDKYGNVTGLKDGVATIIIKLDNGQFGTMKVTVGKGEVKVEEMTPEQKTAFKVEVAFTNEHNFDATGTDDNGTSDKTVKVYRVFSTDEMAKMTNKNGLKLDAEGNGYQAYYVKNTIPTWNADGTQDYTTWVIEGYNAFTDGANYAVVYGENETSSTINGIKAEFTAYVGKVDHIKISATDATVENDVEPAVSAILTTKLYNAQGIDLTDYYNNADETDYELVTEDIDVSVSGNEVTFDEVGSVQVKGSYTYYDEDKEEDVTKEGYVTVYGKAYSTYRVVSIYNWSLASGYKDKWAATTTSMIAGDHDQLYVIVEDNRGNYYSNVPGIEDQNYKINGKKVLGIGSDASNAEENTPFEQYGYELVFDSLDPDSLLVDPDGAVETYKKTNSFAVVSYRRTEDENAKLNEIGVMGIEVKDVRRLNSVNYKNGNSFTILAETEAEDTEVDAYNKEAYKDDFQIYADLTVELWNQYGKVWDDNAEDWDEVEPSFTVTTTKNDFANVADDIADGLNDLDGDGNRTYKITPSIFTGTNTTSVSFKIKESVTGDSTTVTIKLNKPKYVTDANGEETDEVFVDSTRAILEVNGIDVYRDAATPAKLFQVSKATQKIGYFRVGDLEMGDEGHSYYVANDLTKNFVVKVEEGETESEITFVEAPASGSSLTIAASGSGLVSGVAPGDYILVVTDPSGKIFPAYGAGGNGKSFGEGSLLGIKASDDNTAYNLIYAAEKANGEMEYAANGTYRATVYKITNIATNKNTDGEVVSYKFNTSRVSSDSFVIDKTLSNASFYHQENTKTVDVAGFTDTDVVAIKKAIANTMTFRINGENFTVDESGVGKYKSNVDFWGQTYDDEKAFWGSHYMKVEIDSVDFKVQDDGNRAVINTVTFKFYTPVGGYYLNKVKVNRSVNATD